MRLLRTRGSAELGKVASGSATQGLSLGDKKMSSQVVVVDRRRHPGRGTVGEIGREDEEEKSATERRRKYTDLGEREMSKLPAMPQPSPWR